MSTGPAITSWTSRETENAATMNARIRDVNTWLANPPAARVHGKSTAIDNGTGPFTAGLLDFWAPGKEPFTNATNPGLVVASYQSVSGMIKVESDGSTVKELVAPKAGRYRLTLGVCATSDNKAVAGTPWNLYTYLGLNPATTGDEGVAVSNAAITGGALGAFSAFSYFGTRATDITLAAGSRIRAAAVMEGSTWIFADAATTATYQSGSFLEMRWIGEVPS